MPVAIPCPKCLNDPFIDGQVGLGFVELMPIDGTREYWECIWGHRYRIKIEKVTRLKDLKRKARRDFEPL